MPGDVREESGGDSLAAAHETAAARPASNLRAFLAPEQGAGAELLRFAASAAVVTLVAGGLAFVSARNAREDSPTSEADSAIAVDLPAAEAAPRGSSDADDGPPQQAQVATSAPEVPAVAAPPKPAEKEPTPGPPVEPPDLPPPPPLPNPAAALEPKREETPPPPPPVATAPPVAAQEERAPAGSAASTRDAVSVESEDAVPHASRHAVTAWQRSLMRSIEAAKTRVRSPPHSTATVGVAFVIDGAGRLASERVATSSGSPALDTIALALIKAAAPFDPPPKGADAKDASFVVPVRFR